MRFLIIGLFRVTHPICAAADPFWKRSKTAISVLYDHRRPGITIWSSILCEYISILLIRVCARGVVLTTISGVLFIIFTKCIMYFNVCLETEYRTQYYMLVLILTKRVYYIRFLIEKSSSDLFSLFSFPKGV